MKKGTITHAKKILTYFSLIMMFSCQEQSDEKEQKIIPQKEDVRPDAIQKKAIPKDSITPSDTTHAPVDTVQQRPLMNYQYFRRTFTLHKRSYIVIIKGVCGYGIA